MRSFFKILSMLVLASLLGRSAISADESAAFFKQNCVKCHGEEKQKGDLRLDTLAALAGEKDSLETWSLIADVIENGEMPPKKEPRPDPVEVSRLVESITKNLASLHKPIRGIRRMNRFEYENTVHDLLSINTPLAELLPEDSEIQGFDNVASGLGISSVLMERYLDAADEAFDGTIRRIKPLPPSTRRATLMDVKDNIDAVKKNKGGVIEREGAFVDFTPGWPPSRIDPAHPIEGGLYHCKVAVFPHEPGPDRTLSVAIFTGPLFGDGKRHFQGMFDVTGMPDKPRIIDFTTELGEGHTIHILPWVYPEHITYRDKHEQRPGVGVLWAESHGPLDQEFPSAASNQLFGKTESIAFKEGPGIYMRHRKGVKLHYPDSTMPREDAARIIRDLAPRAFRRPVDEALIEQFVSLTMARLDDGATFEQSVRAGVTAVLCSPHFLLLNRDVEVDDYAIASRLSYFLWSSMPDKELLDLAAGGKLSDPKTRYAQVERMLKDPKIERFVTNFTGQWLDLDEIEFTTPDKKIYPEFDELLQRSMVAETTEFFRHLLKNDLSVMNFVDSDFTFLNQRLAEHYGIPGLPGHEEFRLTKLPEDSVRGGLLTQGSILKVTANGANTSPIIRGVWVLDNLMGQPPLPPPAGIPAVEPDIRGATTIREQLDKHRSNESCNRCHARIDPPGFALEQFNAIGGQRDWYRSLGETGEKVGKTGYRVGPDVEKGGEWSDGKQFADFMEFRSQLLEKPDLVARCLAEKLLVYGTGRPVTAADRPVVDAVVEKSQEDDFGLRSMIRAVVESELFFRP